MYRLPARNRPAGTTAVRAPEADVRTEPIRVVAPATLLAIRKIVTVHAPIRQERTAVALTVVPLLPLLADVAGAAIFRATA